MTFAHGIVNPFLTRTQEGTVTQVITAKTLGSTSTIMFEDREMRSGFAAVTDIMGDETNGGVHGAVVGCSNVRECLSQWPCPSLSSTDSICTVVQL